MMYEIFGMKKIVKKIWRSSRVFQVVLICTNKENRYPTASVNFITAHDGFTLHDLVSYNQKHNELNKHNNTDGSDKNYSFNFGVEGPTENISVTELRKRQKRNFLTTLFLSQGTPMLLAGDEFGRTQKGNNNAYCQDNELSWLNWNDVDDELLIFVKHLFSLENNILCFQGIAGFLIKQITSYLILNGFSRMEQSSQKMTG